MPIPLSTQVYANGLGTLRLRSTLCFASARSWAGWLLRLSPRRRRCLRRLAFRAREFLLLDCSGSQSKNSVEDLRIPSSVDRVTVYRFDSAFFSQPDAAGSSVTFRAF